MGVDPRTKARWAGFGICLISWPVPLLFLLSPYPKLATPAWVITYGLLYVVYLQRVRLTAWAVTWYRRRTDS